MGTWTPTPWKHQSISREERGQKESASCSCVAAIFSPPPPVPLAGRQSFAQIWAPGEGSFVHSGSRYVFAAASAHTDSGSVPSPDNLLVNEDLPELTPHLRLHPLWTLTMFMLEPRPQAPHLQKLPWRRCALQPPAESDPLSTLHGYSWAACCNITMFCPAPLAPGAEGRAALGCPLAWHRAGHSWLLVSHCGARIPMASFGARYPQLPKEPQLCVQPPSLALTWFGWQGLDTSAVPACSKLLVDCRATICPTHLRGSTDPLSPFAVSGRQLQPEEPDAETEEDRSVTEGPVDEIIRPRPQGSSPVYECVTEGASFRLPSTQDETEVTLKTEAEAGASGYSVTGGGDQGIFIKQVLKDSSAAKLFSLREGDQLLSTTIFFDNIKYEDALKILQYSEPYKVQFKIKRKLPAAEDEEWAAGEAEHGPKGSEKQDQDVADGCTETPTKMLEGDGDQERLISKAREDRGRRPQRERLSWPKFQSIKTKRRPGPRRSHSSSEAYERGDVPDVSPTSTDTEAQLPAEERERRAGPGSQRKTRFLSLRFRMGSGKAAGLEGRGAPGGTVQAGVLEEAVPGEEGQGAAVVAADSRRKDSMAGVQEEAEPPTEPGLSLEGTLGEGAGLAPRSRKKKKEAKVQEETVPQRTSGVGAAPGCREEGPREGGQGLEIGIARLSLQEPRDQDSQDGREPEFQIRIPTLKTPKFTFPKGKALGAKGAGTALHLEDRQGGYPGEDLGTKEDGGGEPDAQGRPAPVQKPDQEDRGTQEYATEKRVQDTKGRDRDVGGREGKTKMLKFKLPSFGWSPGKEQKGDAVKQPQETEKEENMLLSLQTDICQEDRGIRSRREKEMELPEQKLPQKETIETKEEPAAGIGMKGHLPKVHVPGIKVPKVDLKAPQVDIKGPKLEVKGAKGEVTAPDLDVSLPSVEVDTQAPGAKLEGDLALGDKEVAAKEKKFKMPKFKMPSFGVSAPGKSIEAAVDVSLPNAQADVSLPSVQADVKTSDLSIELPPAELDVKAAEAAVKLPEGHLPEVELKEPAAGIGLKGHLPKVHVPGIKVPKVDLKAPQVDIKGPKLEVKGAKGEVTAPDLDVSLPSVEVDTQAPGAKLEGDLALGDKEVAAKEKKFKMPKFKMPSFGVSAPGKSIETAVDVSLPKAQADVSLPSVQADVKTSDLSIELPPAELDVKAAEAAVKLPEGHLPEVELKEPAAGIGLKGHLPKVHVPGIKVPKVDLKAPQVDIKGPKLEVKGAKGEVTAPDLEVSLPSVEVDTQAPGAKLEGVLALGDKEEIQLLQPPGSRQKVTLMPHRRLVVRVVLGTLAQWWTFQKEWVWTPICHRSIPPIWASPDLTSGPARPRWRPRLQAALFPGTAYRWGTAAKAPGLGTRQQASLMWRAQRRALWRACQARSGAGSERRPCACLASSALPRR
ncbi:protein AHNAK2-like protein [Camelus ferus]|nr:protein AHNAK2-like protein [Camelus ferus]